MSTDGQSAEAQITTLKAGEAEKVFAEKISGTVTARKALARAIAALGPGDLLLVTKLDHLARSTRDLLNTCKLSATVVPALRSSMTQRWTSRTPTGSCSSASSIVEFERSLILARTGEGRTRAMARGVRFGRKPKLLAFQVAEAIAATDIPHRLACFPAPDLITERHQTQGLFTVSVIGWRELVRRATRHQLVAAKHFGSYAAGPASPLLATWRASAGKLLLDDRELGIAIRELIHDLRDYPAGRIVFRQKESEDLLFQIKQLQAAGGQSLDEREAVLELRDKLKIQRDREGAVVAGLTLLFGHKDLKDYVRIVWEREAPLLIRSFVEQRIDPDLGIVTGLEKIRLHPPGYQRIRTSHFWASSSAGQIQA